LDTQNIEGINGSVEIFARFYSKKVNAKFIKQIELAARRLKDRI
jgi:acylphosphatase